MYRCVTVVTPRGREAHLVRVSDAAVAEWLLERDELRTRGYPDRPPDIDTPTLRAWVPRPGEEALPYFYETGASYADAHDLGAFPILALSWHQAAGPTAKVLLTGFWNGAIACRVVVAEPSGACPIDRVHLLAPEADPELVWAEVEAIVRHINEAPMAWQAHDPMLTTYDDFVALDREVAEAEADLRRAKWPPASRAVN